jgi:hypothetical protein
MLRDRPFNLKGWGYGFLFHSEFFFRTTQELELLFFCRAKREIFFQDVTLGYMTKTLNQIIFFFLHQNQNICFSNIGNQNIFLEKKPYPQVKWSFPKSSCIHCTDIYVHLLIKGRTIYFLVGKYIFSLFANLFKKISKIPKG